MEYKPYNSRVWDALCEWIDSGRDPYKLEYIARTHKVLADDVEYMLEDCLD